MFRDAQILLVKVRVKFQIWKCVTKCKFIDKYVKKNDLRKHTFTFFKRDELAFCASKASFCSHFPCCFQNFDKKLYLRWKSLNKITKQSSIFNFPLHNFKFFQKILWCQNYEQSVWDRETLKRLAICFNYKKHYKKVFSCFSACFFVKLLLRHFSFDQVMICHAGSKRKYNLKIIYWWGDQF